MANHLNREEIRPILPLHALGWSYRLIVVYTGTPPHYVRLAEHLQGMFLLMVRTKIAPPTCSYPAPNVEPFAQLCAGQFDHDHSQLPTGGTHVPVRQSVTPAPKGEPAKPLTARRISPPLTMPFGNAPSVSIRATIAEPATRLNF